MKPRRRAFKLSIAFEAGREHRAYLRTHLRAVADLLDERPEVLSVAVVGDATMSELHVRYLGIAGPTDVLTFELERAGDRGVEGEVVICLDEARRRAATEADIPAELLLYAGHGLLHLSGYDDRDADAFARMHAKEDELLSAIGVGAVFRRDRE